MPDSPAFRHLYTRNAHEHALAHRSMMNMREHGQEHGRAAWTRSMGMDMHHEHGDVPLAPSYG
jgi:hypothetical protein